MSEALAVETLLPFGSRAAGDRTRVYGFPHAGGEHSAYGKFALELAPEFDFQPVRLPRGGMLPDGRASDDPRALVPALGAALSSELRPPYVLFGHSMGAVLAAELTAWLECRALAGPELLIVSACAGRQAGWVRPSELERDDAALTQWVLGLGGTDPALLADMEMRSLVLDGLRHDLRLLHAYRPTYRRLAAPVLALGGVRDPRVRETDLGRWRERTTAAFRLRMFPGGHFYLYEHARAIAGEISRMLTAARAAQPGQQQERR
ncbi:thioesterase II family protein [Micromonospora sp. DT4]|uniref:thioesterase II family protein n=1 Tax=Micromonospora sp. DT4 TaxID=3393438 RepID=UPI003CE8B087